MTEEKDKDMRLWKLAQERVGFKKHLIIYVVISLFLWIIWWFISYIKGLSADNMVYGFPWPVYPCMAWGLAVFLHYLLVYKWKSDQVEKEYEKLLKKNK